MSKWVKIFLSLIFYYSGVVSIIRTLIGQKAIRILAYHKIENDRYDYLNMSIPVSDFEAQVKYLSKHYHVISLADAVHIIQTTQKIRRNTVVLTFDDGYRDNYTNAFPITKKYNVPMTIFLSVDSINTRQPLWYEIITHLINNTSKREVDLLEYGLGKMTFKNSSDRQEALKKIVGQAKRMQEKQKQNLINYLTQKLADEGINQDLKNQMLSWDEITEMKNNGVIFGAHTMSHPILTRIPLQSAKLEIVNSKQVIEKETGERVSFFAYPNGGPDDFNEEIIQIIKESGFSCACSLISGVVKSDDDLFALKRMGVDQDFIGWTKFMTKALFATEMSGIFDIMFMRF